MLRNFQTVHAFKFRSIKLATWLESTVCLFIALFCLCLRQFCKVIISFPTLNPLEIAILIANNYEICIVLIGIKFVLKDMWEYRLLVNFGTLYVWNLAILFFGTWWLRLLFGENLKFSWKHFFYRVFCSNLYNFTLTRKITKVNMWYLKNFFFFRMIWIHRYSGCS